MKTILWQECIARKERNACALTKPFCGYALVLILYHVVKTLTMKAVYPFFSEMVMHTWQEIDFLIWYLGTWSVVFQLLICIFTTVCCRLTACDLPQDCVLLPFRSYSAILIGVAGVDQCLRELCCCSMDTNDIEKRLLTMGGAVRCGCYLQYGGKYLLFMPLGLSPQNVGCNKNYCKFTFSYAFNFVNSQKSTIHKSSKIS